MGRDSKDAAIFVAGAAVGAVALFCLTKAAQSSKIATKNGKTHSGNDDISEVAAARTEVSPIIFDDSTTSWFRNLDTPATIQRPRRPGMLHLALDYAATLSGSGPGLLTRSRINHSKLEDVDTPRRLTMILYS